MSMFLENGTAKVNGLAPEVSIRPIYGSLHLMIGRDEVAVVRVLDFCAGVLSATPYPPDHPFSVFRKTLAVSFFKPGFRRNYQEPSWGKGVQISSKLNWFTQSSRAYDSELIDFYSLKISPTDLCAILFSIIFCINIESEVDPMVLFVRQFNPELSEAALLTAAETAAKDTSAVS